MLAYAQDLPPKGAHIEVAGVKAEVTKDDGWETIGMIVVLVLAVYLGIRLINKYIKWFFMMGHTRLLIGAGGPPRIGISKSIVVWSDEKVG